MSVLDKVLSNLIYPWLGLPGGIAVCNPLLRDLPRGCGDGGGTPVVLTLGFEQI